MRLRKSKRKLPARNLDAVDRAAIAEAEALLKASHNAAHITSSIPWAPSKPAGKRGWLRLTETRHLRGQFVRGNSNRTPKLVSSYVRMFG